MKVTTVHILPVLMCDECVFAETDVDEGHDWDILNVNEGLGPRLSSPLTTQDGFADLLTSVLNLVL